MNDEDDRKPSAIKVIESIDANEGSAAKIVKPALKKKAPLEEKTTESSEQDKEHDKKAKKHLKWDEEAIEEHDLLRGTRMKIEEPDTPFAYYDSGSESDGSRRAKSPANEKPTLNWDALQTKLESVATVQEACASSPSCHGESGTDQSDTEAEARRKETKRLIFMEHRKRHYNEMEKVRKWRQEHSADHVLDDDRDDADTED